jgi:hypothetical protein
MEQVFHSRQIRLQCQEQNMFVTKIQAYFRPYKTYMNQILHNEFVYKSAFPIYVQSNKVLKFPISILIMHRHQLWLHHSSVNSYS